MYVKINENEYGKILKQREMQKPKFFLGHK